MERSRDLKKADRSMKPTVDLESNLAPDELMTTTNSTHWFNRQSAMPHISAAWGADQSQGRVAILGTSAMWGAIAAAGSGPTNVAAHREF